jgi:hypothetical protein
LLNYYNIILGKILNNSEFLNLRYLLWFLSLGIAGNGYASRV